MFRTPNHLSAPVSTRADSIDDDIIQHAWSVLEAVPDPEIPVVSIRELGILRNVTRAADGAIEVVITPTYSGCPAMAQIAEDIGRALDAAKLGPYHIETTLAPAWTTEWITDAARAKLHAYGVAPPVGDGASATAERVIRFMPSARALPTCPRCNSAHTERLAQFGSTACKALYRCLDCREPFDYFKPY